MNFISIPFLMLFLPAAFVLHKLARPIWMKNVVLLAASLIFYACYDVKYLLFLAASIMITYFGARLGEHQKLNKKLYIYIYTDCDSEPWNFACI